MIKPIKLHRISKEIAFRDVSFLSQILRAAFIDRVALFIKQVYL